MPLHLNTNAVPNDADLARAVLLRLAERRRVRRLAAEVASRLVSPPRASRA